MVVPLFLKLPCFSHSLQPAAPAAANRRSLFASKPRDDLTACSMCGRNFAEDRIDKGLTCFRSLSTFKLILLEILQSYTGWPFRLFQTSSWHQNKSSVPVEGPCNKTQFLFWCQPRGWPDVSPCKLATKVPSISGTWVMDAKRTHSHYATQFSPKPFLRL